MLIIVMVPYFCDRTLNTVMLH